MSAKKNKSIEEEKEAILLHRKHFSLESEKRNIDSNDDNPADIEESFMTLRDFKAKYITHSGDAGEYNSFRKNQISISNAI